MTNIFVAKLDFGVSDEELKALFERYGVVRKCQIAKDRETGKPRGFAFVEMQTAEEAQAAISGLDGHTFNGRAMVVKLAEDRSSGGGNRRPQQSPRPQSSSDSRPPRPASPSTPRSEEPPVRRDSDDDAPASDFSSEEKATKRGKNKKKKPTDKPENREYKMSAYKKSGKKPRADFQDDDDWELELLKQKRRGWSDDDDE